MLFQNYNGTCQIREVVLLMSSTSRNTGFIVALICGILGLLAFFALPFVSFLGVGATALSVATGGSQVSGIAAVFWVEFLLAGLITLMAGLQFSKSATVSRQNTAGGCLLALGITGTIICILFIIILGSVSGFALSLLGIGFWLFFLTVIGTIVGAVMARKQLALQASGVSPSSPYTQYPPSQQTPMQQSSSSQYPSYQQPSSGQYPPYQQPSSGQYPSQDYPPSAGRQ